MRKQSTQAYAPGFTPIAMLAAAFAQSAIGSRDEDDTLTPAVSTVLELFVTRCDVAKIRNHVEDRLTVTQRRAAHIVERVYP